MNILFWGLESPPHQGGIGVYMMTMAQALVSNGHRVTWITAIHPGCPAEKEVGGVHLRRCYHPRDIRSRKLAENLCAIAREMRADWIEGADHLGECATLLALRRRPPVLIKAHGPQCLWRIQKTQVHHLWQTLPLAGALLKILPQLIGEWKCLERADALLAPGPSMLSLLRAHGIRLPARHGVIPNPVSDQPPTRSGDEALNPTILMCGRLAFMKGISRVGLILQRLCSACPEVRLEIAGADSYAWGIGSLEAWLRNDLQRAGVMSNVRFLGRLPEDKLDQAYRRAWVLMHPSLWESFGNVLPEAMIRQRPVVASRVGDIPDLLEGTGNISADPGTSDFSDALIRFLSDSQLRAVAGQQGREKVRQQYGPDVIAARYIRFLEGGGE